MIQTDFRLADPPQMEAHSVIDDALVPDPTSIPKLTSPAEDSDRFPPATVVASGRHGSSGDSETGEQTLLESLDRRQNKVLHELNRLNAEIEEMVERFQQERQRAREAA